MATKKRPTKEKMSIQALASEIGENVGRAVGSAIGAEMGAALGIQVALDTLRRLDIDADTPEIEVEGHEESRCPPRYDGDLARETDEDARIPRVLRKKRK
jgi:hypothetical protein